MLRRCARCRMSKEDHLLYPAQIYRAETATSPIWNAVRLVLISFYIEEILLLPALSDHPPDPSYLRKIALLEKLSPSLTPFDFLRLALPHVKFLIPLV